MIVSAGSGDRASVSVAIMQPYFFPYAGYFRLLAQADLFVIYDCVQFPRRGWVHRNKLPDVNGVDQWLTLPLRKSPQDILIRDLQFSADARDVLAERLQAFPLLSSNFAVKADVLKIIFSTEQTVADYIVATMAYVARYLALPWSGLRSSSLNVPESFRGQDRIIEIARRVGASRYINAPGGRALYDSESFAKAGLELDFLPPYEGSTRSILSRILEDDRDALRGDILSK